MLFKIGILVNTTEHAGSLSRSPNRPFIPLSFPKNDNDVGGQLGDLSAGLGYSVSFFSETRIRF